MAANAPVILNPRPRDGAKPRTAPGGGVAAPFGGAR